MPPGLLQTDRGQPASSLLVGRQKLPLTVNASRPVSSLDYFFRALTLLGVLELGALGVNLVAHPHEPGPLGQGFLIRLALGLLVAPTALIVGALVVWRVPGNAVGRLLILGALGALSAQFSLAAVEPGVAARVINLFILYGAGVAAPSMGYLMLTFPDGHVYPPRLARVVIPVAAVKFIGAGLEIMASPGKIRIFQHTLNPFFVPALAPYQPLIAATIGIAGILLPIIWLSGIVSLVLRYRAAPAPIQRQLKWVVWALATLIPAMLFMAGGVLTGYVVAGWALPLAAGFGTTALALFLAATTLAIVRYRLFDIDVILNRALVYGALTAGVVGAYALLVGLAGELFHQSGSLMVSLLATGLIAVLFQPLRERVQRAVNRLMYGERDEPYEVLSRLGRRLEATLDPEAVLPAVAESVARTFKLPYVGIALREGDAFRVVAEYGLPPPAAQPAGKADPTGEAATGEIFALPLTYQHEPIGQLRVGPRAHGEAFTAAEQRLLADIAHQAGVAAHAVRLTADLQRSRERLVNAREEERRRLRRDLHDGLGPALAAQTLKAGSAHALLDRDPAAAGRLLKELERDIEAAVGDIRRLVYALRPPALDELGLAGALRDTAAAYSTNGLEVTLEAPMRLPSLPAATDVAVYRITQEALTNVVRHARAQRCAVSLVLDGELRLEISDDGRGLPGDRRAGVGLVSMRERAEELGGTCLIENAPTGGTRVIARLPIGHD
jgi:signal transduction histidine kinase